MARRQPPPPKCACGHLYAIHAGSAQCRFIVKHVREPGEKESEHDCEKCERCKCPKFRVPDGPGRKKKTKKQQMAEATAAGLAVTVATAGHVPGAGFVVRKAMQPKGTPWWR